MCEVSERGCGEQNRMTMHIQPDANYKEEVTARTNPCAGVSQHQLEFHIDTERNDGETAAREELGAHVQ